MRVAAAAALALVALALSARQFGSDAGGRERPLRLHERAARERGIHRRCRRQERAPTDERSRYQPLAGAFAGRHARRVCEQACQLLGHLRQEPRRHRRAADHQRLLVRRLPRLVARREQAGVRAHVRRGGMHIIVYDFSDGSRRDITPDNAIAYHPRWSPDGTKIVYDGTRYGTTTGLDIYVVNPDGSGRRQLTLGAGWERQPAWSPDGKQIAYTGYPTYHTDIYGDERRREPLEGHHPDQEHRRVRAGLVADRDRVPLEPRRPRRDLSDAADRHPHHHAHEQHRRRRSELVPGRTPPPLRQRSRCDERDRHLESAARVPRPDAGQVVRHDPAWSPDGHTDRVLAKPQVWAQRPLRRQRDDGRDTPVDEPPRDEAGNRHGHRTACRLRSSTSRASVRKSGSWG